jgi:acetyltransferase-like isoleucine patch superfamily enzyme
MPSLNQLIRVQRLLVRARNAVNNRFWGMSIHPTAVLSMSAKLDKTHPRGIHIGERSYVAFGAAILSHDMTRGLRRDTRIGRHCFIGARSLVLPGVTIGDESIVAAGAIVTRDVPPRSIVAGNPAAVVRSGIDVGPYGRLRRDAASAPPNASR